MTGNPGGVVYLAGTRWGGVAGTDRRLASALGAIVPVLWVDPPFSWLTRGRGVGGGIEANRAGRTLVAPGVTRLQVLTFPGGSRPGLRGATARMLRARIRAAIRAMDVDVSAVVLASPRERFPLGVAGTRILYVTDDWAAGAEMMGLPATRVRANLAHNVAAADAVAAVSPELADRLQRTYGALVEVLPNGCEPVPPGAEPAPGDDPAAGLVGQLNERLDPAILEAIVAGGTPLVVIGPRTERDAGTRVALDRLLSANGVTWRGELAGNELPTELARMGVGLVPYLDNPFNRASFPLKILEYLASGLPVVSTDLPAVHWLNTDLIAVGRNPEDFACRVREVLARPADAADRSRRIAFAEGHSWRARATRLLSIAAERAAGRPRQ